MQTPLRFVFVFAVAGLFAASLRADESLLHARRAQTLLGSDIWSQVIRIENRARQSRYPRQLHALVFELAGILWFYTETDGTQSFSLHRGRLEQEKADFAPLLRDIEPGFATWRVVDAGAEAIEPGILPNGCFIESVGALRARLVAGEPVENPQLLSYYAQTAGGVNGHTVLTYRIAGEVEVIDSAQADKVFRFPAALAADPVALARALEGPGVATARLLALQVPCHADVGLRLAATGDRNPAFSVAAR